MNETQKTRHLAERFNKYINYRKTVEKTGSSFTEQLTNKVNKIDESGGKKAHTNAVSGAGRHQPPRLAKAKTITEDQAARIARYAPIIESAARKYGVPVELICGVILQESGGNARAVSSAGARGLMQLMPQTARRFGVSNSFDPVQNIHGGARYLRFLLDRFGGNLELALAGYNAGEANVEKHGNRVPPFRETRAYVPNVLGYTQSMINIFYARLNQIDLPPHAKRV